MPTEPSSDPTLPTGRWEVCVEVPRGSRVRRRLSDGAVVFRSPWPCPFNYGHLPGTLSGDGEPMDAVLLGQRLPFRAFGEGVVVGVVDFRDMGRWDPKVLLSPTGALTRRDTRAVERFFRRYARLKWLLFEPSAFRGLRLSLRDR